MREFAAQASYRINIRRWSPRFNVAARLESIEAGGTAWDVIKFEIESEFRLLSDELALSEETLDADEMKHTK
jgi:hypothetical protein